jgi:chromosome segregation ATPase
MNRSILIVIVDFLLVSLMAFSNLESLTLEPAEQQRLDLPPVTTEASEKSDLLKTLKLALDMEQRNREKLAAELAKARDSVETQFAERDSKIQQFEENLRRAETEARQIEQERATLQQQVASAQTNLQSLQAALAATRSEAKLTRDQLQASQADIRQREAEAETLRQRLTTWKKSQQRRPRGSN